MEVWISFFPRGGEFAYQKNSPGFASGGEGGDGQAWN